MSKLRAGRSGKEPQRLVAVAASEDASTEARVNEFCRNLSRQLGQKGEISKQIWLLSELRVHQLRTIAANEAATADMIIVAVHHAEKLPDELEQWIEQWVNQKSGKRRVLLALFDPLHQGVSTSMQTYLKEAAKRGRLEFMVQTDETPRDR